MAVVLYKRLFYSGSPSRKGWLFSSQWLAQNSA